jgi:Ca2+-binding EF-hand superfamily protein
MPIFIEPGDCNSVQLGFLTVVYGWVLYTSSGLIAEGSELLLLFPSVAGLVGSVVLPILGAVPDGVMVLFSGMGPIEEAQDQVSVGVGALAGSTVMLLTFPWYLAVNSGAVPLNENGVAQYGSKAAQEPSSGRLGVTYSNALKKGAKIMMMTTVLYLIIQIPATLQESKTDDAANQAKGEHLPALIGIVACIIAFMLYLRECVKEANEDKALEAVIDGIKSKQISITAALQFAKSTSKNDLSQPLKNEDAKRLKKIIRPFFAHYDLDGSGHLDVTEFNQLLIELGERSQGQKVVERFKEQDKDNSGTLSFDEVADFLYVFIRDELSKKPEEETKIQHVMPAYDEDEEEEAIPEDLADLSPSQQLRRVLFRSIWMMGVGTLLVLIFSDPMVDCLSAWGKRTGIPAFYISFVLAPLASNASELLSAYTYAAKKSQKSITTALSTLIGAACMNNTFCLCIFLCLVYFRGLAWQFTAETVSIVLIQWVIGLLVIGVNTHNKVHAVIILLCYPGCLGIVWALENVVGWD